MDGFGFIQYDNPDDAKDIVPGQCPSRPPPKMTHPRIFRESQP